VIAAGHAVRGWSNLHYGVASFASFVADQTLWCFIGSLVGHGCERRDFDSACFVPRLNHCGITLGHCNAPQDCNDLVLAQRRMGDGDTRLFIGRVSTSLYP